jgi:hypothetical protein
LVVSGVEQKARGTGLGHLTPGKKATITGSSNTDPVVVTGGMTSQMQMLNIAVNKLFRDHLTQLYCE